MNRDRARFVLAMAAVAANTLVMCGLLMMEVPAKNESTIGVALGLFMAWGGMVMGYFFGTTESSQRKTDIIAAQNAASQNGDDNDRPTP